MLKLKKGNTTKIILHTRQSRYSPDFFKGLGLACLFHFFLFSVLRITFPHSPDESHLLPFTEVDAEWGVEAAMIPHIAPDRYVIAFEECEPQMIAELLPEISNCKKSLQLDVEPDFSALEGIEYPLDFEDEND